MVDADEYDETDEDDDAEEDDAYFHYGDPDVTSKTFGKPIDPSEKGLALRFGGEFGEVGRASRKKEGMGALVWGKGRALGKIEKARFGKVCVFCCHLCMFGTGGLSSLELGMHSQYCRNSRRQPDSTSILWTILVQL